MDEIREFGSVTIQMKATTAVAQYFPGDFPVVLFAMMHKAALQDKTLNSSGNCSNKVVHQYFPVVLFFAIPVQYKIRSILSSF